MAAIDFPANPTVGQRFTAGGIIWTWDGLKWTLSGSGSISINDAPPTNPLDGALWWDTVSGNLFIYYDDGTSAQWVVAVNLNTAGPVGPEGPQGDPGPTGPVGPMGPAPLQAIGDNRIINGDMRISQRYDATPATVAGYTLDRWQIQANPMAGEVTQGGPDAVLAPLGFAYHMYHQFTTAVPSLAADDYFSFVQYIEADYLTDFAWGTPDAQPVTLSFLAAASVPGTYSVSIRSAPSPDYRSYPATFEITGVGTWEQVTITIPGDTGGDWALSGNDLGLAVFFCFGVGTTYGGPPGAWADENYVGAAGTVNLAATVGNMFWLTGVKLEIGDVATPYPRQSMATSLADCQRYYQVLSAVIISEAYGSAGSARYESFVFPTTMRANPTVTPSGVQYSNSSGFLMNNISPNNVTMAMVVGAANGQAYAQGSIILDAEL